MFGSNLSEVVRSPKDLGDTTLISSEILNGSEPACRVDSAYASRSAAVELTTIPTANADQLNSM